MKSYSNNVVSQNELNEKIKSNRKVALVSVVLSSLAIFGMIAIAIVHH